MKMEKTLSEVRKHIKFKPDTVEGDIILVGMPAGLFYGYVQDIQKNVKKNWYNFSFKLLLIPPVDITWILRIPQMTGDIFTINEEEHFVTAIDPCRVEHVRESTDTPEKTKKEPWLSLVKDGNKR
jgi:hypothetical protein